MATRIEQIKSMLATSPQDVFLHYSLGMEYLAAGEVRQAAEAFRRCVELDDAYVPARIELGKALRAAGELAAARAELQQALARAEQAGERHTCDYIRQQIEGLPA